MRQIKKSFYRVEGGYCTFCHEEDDHKGDCPIPEWQEEEQSEKPVTQT